MKKIILSVMAISTAVNGTIFAQGDNPLLKNFETPHQTPPFEQIKLEHYIPAFEAALEQAKKEVADIIENPEAPDFENMIVALERHGELLNMVLGIFFPLNSSETSDQMDDIANHIMPALTEYSNDISLDPGLFERVKRIYDDFASDPGAFDLDPEQRMLLEKTYKSFTRNGAGLSEEDKEEYRRITSELSVLTLKFGQNVLGATNAYILEIPEEKITEMDYMPDFVKEGLAAEAREKGKTGWVVTLQSPSYHPFMTYSRDSKLKEQLWKAYNSRGNTDGEFDNREITKRIAELRLKVARLLGYNNYADYVLEERMAMSIATVNGFLDELLVSTMEWARDDFNQVVKFARTQPGSPRILMPWDFSYYDEAYKTAKYSLNDELVKPYFRLENVEKGVFDLATKLYGISFKENPSIQVYHPDVKAFEVYDNDGSFISVLYMDYFPRESKRGGAWMTNFRDMYTRGDGTVVHPLVTLNFNFTKPAGDTPSLLTFDEVVTFLHEFGHGLHGIFAQGKYSSLTGTAVYRDFVELPSQLMENWATEKEFLDLWAVHYQTGEKIPADLVDKIIAAKNYLAAYLNIRQLAYGMNDMAWHTITEPVEISPEAFEKNAISSAQLLPLVDGTCSSTAFTHIFSGGYAAGYYSYKWAEVLEADAFSLFLEKGIFSREAASLFRDNILSKGGSEHPMELYKRFRGHEPQTKALIDKIGEGR